jgi:hypothetical protein
VGAERDEDERKFLTDPISFRVEGDDGARCPLHYKIADQDLYFGLLLLSLTVGYEVLRPGRVSRLYETMPRVQA